MYATVKNIVKVHYNLHLVDKIYHCDNTESLSGLPWGFWMTLELKLSQTFWILLLFF